MNVLAICPPKNGLHARVVGAVEVVVVVTKGLDLLCLKYSPPTNHTETGCQPQPLPCPPPPSGHPPLPLAPHTSALEIGGAGGVARKKGVMKCGGWGRTRGVEAGVYG